MLLKPLIELIEKSKYDHQILHHHPYHQPVVREARLFQALQSRVEKKGVIDPSAEKEGGYQLEHEIHI